MPDIPLSPKKLETQKLETHSELKVMIDRKVKNKLERYCKATNFQLAAVVEIAIADYLEGTVS